MLSSRTSAFFIAAEEPVLSEAEGISVLTAVERQPAILRTSVVEDLLTMIPC